MEKVWKSMRYGCKLPLMELLVAHGLRLSAGEIYLMRICDEAFAQAIVRSGAMHDPFEICETVTGVPFYVAHFIFDRGVGDLLLPLRADTAYFVRAHLPADLANVCMDYVCGSEDDIRKLRNDLWSDDDRRDYSRALSDEHGPAPRATDLYTYTVQVSRWALLDEQIDRLRTTCIKCQSSWQKRNLATMPCNWSWFASSRKIEQSEATVVFELPFDVWHYGIHYVIPGNFAVLKVAPDGLTVDGIPAVPHGLPAPQAVRAPAAKSSVRPKAKPSAKPPAKPLPDYDFELQQALSLSMIEQ
jgi:hypothetical protein